MPFLVQSREQFEYNTDPQRRCYDGHHAKSEWSWSPWRTLSSCENEDEARERVESWRAYNKDVRSRRLEYRHAVVTIE